jgi:casein kinase I family protein HRR25
MGTGKAVHLVNVIDFGLAKKFRDPRTNMHIPYHKDDYHGVGTSLFAAINTHLGSGMSLFLFSQVCQPTRPPLPESSRRDDLESLAYMLIYFLRGSLPWKKLKGSTVSETWDLIRDKKIETEPLLTVGLPAEFDVLYKYTRGLEFDDLPDYAGIRALFRSLAKKRGIEYDGMFDWTLRTEDVKKRYCHACNTQHIAR